MAKNGNRELTVTALILGVLLAVVFGAANAYLGLRVGLTVSASVPAAVISMVVLRFVLRRDSILENNMVQTIGSAGESLAAGAIFTLPALYLWAEERPAVGFHRHRRGHSGGACGFARSGDACRNRHLPSHGAERDDVCGWAPAVDGVSPPRRGGRERRRRGNALFGRTCRRRGALRDNPRNTCAILKSPLQSNTYGISAPIFGIIYPKRPL